MSDIVMMAPSAARRDMDWSSSAGRRIQDSYGGHITLEGGLCKSAVVFTAQPEVCRDFEMTTDR